MSINSAQLKRLFISGIKFWILSLIVFLLIGRSTFLIHNWNYGTQGLYVIDILSILFHGFSYDAIAAAMLAGICLLCRRWKLAIGIVSMLTAIVLIGDASLWQFWEMRINSSVFEYLRHPIGLFASLSTKDFATYIFLILVLSALITYLLLLEHITWKMSTYCFLGIGIVLLICCLLPKKTIFSDNEFVNQTTLNPICNLFDGIQNDEECDEEMFADLISIESISTRKILSSTRPNILIIILESFGGGFIDSLSITPGLNKLKHEGVYFSQCYASSHRTDKALPAIISGYPIPASRNPIEDSISITALPSIPKTLKRNGYSTYCLYGGDLSYMNFGNYFKFSMHDSIVSKDHFSVQEQTQQWGVPDEITFDFLLQTLQEKQSPWYATYLTLSSHTPYDVPFVKLRNKKMNSFAYTDSCLNHFIEEMRRLKIWDNTLIICLADHTFPDRKTPKKDRYLIPMIWTGGAVKKHYEETMLLNQTDLAATLLGQLNISHQDFLFSRDVFSKTYNYPFTFSTFNNGFIFRDSTGQTIYDNKSKRVLVPNDKTANTPENLHRVHCGRMLQHMVNKSFQ